MATDESPMIKHTFELADVPPTEPFEFVVVVGSWNDWDLQTGELMTFDVDAQAWKADRVTIRRRVRIQVLHLRR